MLFLRDILKTKEHKREKMRSRKEKKAKRNLGQQYYKYTKQVFKEKAIKEHQIIIKEKFYQEGITILNLFISNTTYKNVYNV